MPFTPVTYVTGGPPGLDGNAFNNMQLQYSAAINAFEQDLFTPFVFSGLVATRDGTTLSQLDVTAGVAFLKQADGENELYRVAPTATTFSTTGNASTTMYLDLNPDGTWSWATTHSAVANALTIASVTTDASANIATVTDARTLDTTLLSGMAGSLRFDSLLKMEQAGSTSAATNYLVMANTTSAVHQYNVYISPGGNFGIWDNNAGGSIMEATRTAMTIFGALTFGAYDGSLSTIRDILVYEGTVDPSTYTTPPEGSLWADG